MLCVRGGVNVVWRVAFVAEIDPEFAPHNLVVVEVPNGGGGRLRVAVFCEAEAFRTARFAVVDKSEGEHPAGRGEDFRDLFFG